MARASGERARRPPKVVAGRRPERASDGLSITTMIQKQTMLKVTDNTGAKVIQCFHVLGGSKRKYGRIGDVIVAAVKKAEPRRQVKKHDVVRAVIVRQKQPFRRKDGSYIRFDENAVVILEGKTKRPRGGRVAGPIPRELKEKGFEEIASLAEELV